MINKELNNYQQIWFEGVFKPYVENNPEKNISNPFFLGISSRYEQAKKKIMIVGQETHGWSVYSNDCSIDDSQRWAVNYLDYQLHYSYDDHLKEEFGRRNSSPFWSFFKLFSRDDIVPCWNNIDKAQRCIGGKTKSLTEEIELELNKTLPDSSKTLFQKEIEIAKPDIIAFITGPRYYATMESAMNLKKDSLKNKLSYASGCLDITDISKLGVPTFWTYHPNHIRCRKELSRIDIANTIKKGLL